VSSGAADELLHAVVIWAQRRVRGSGEWLIRSVDVPVQVDVYEGTPDSPERGRWWKIIERNGVTISYIPPTAIRSFMKQGEEISKRHDMSSLQILGSVGEPINPEAYAWYRRVIGADRTPVVDTWWQTETGAIMISPLPGIAAELVDDEATRCPTAPAATWPSPHPGRRCCAPCGATTSATWTGRRCGMPGGRQHECAGRWSEGSRRTRRPRLGGTSHTGDLREVVGTSSSPAIRLGPNW
jgi:hypothetical protein